MTCKTSISKINIVKAYIIYNYLKNTNENEIRDLSKLYEKWIKSHNDNYLNEISHIINIDIKNIYEPNKVFNRKDEKLIINNILNLTQDKKIKWEISTYPFCFCGSFPGCKSFYINLNIEEKILTLCRFRLNIKSKNIYLLFQKITENYTKNIPTEITQYLNLYRYLFSYNNRKNAEFKNTINERIKNIKVGDYITDEYGSLMKVIEINDDEYLCSYYNETINKTEDKTYLLSKEKIILSFFIEPHKQKTFDYTKTFLEHFGLEN